MVEEFGAVVVAQLVEGGEVVAEGVLGCVERPAWRGVDEQVVQHLATDHLDPHTAELLAALPEPDTTPVGHHAADLLGQLPEPVGRRVDRSLADELLAELPDPIDDQLADQVAAVTARLDRLQHKPPAVDDDYGIGL